MNGDIITVRTNSPIKHTLIVKGKTIQFVGSKEETMNIASKNYKIVDLKVNTLLTAFIVGHADFTSFFAQAITIWSAHQHFEEHQKVTLEVGG